MVVGTCPDLGVITAIPQPLRAPAHTRGVRLARAQTAAVKAAGGVPVPLGHLLAPKFRAMPELMFSADRYHPSAPAYALAADLLFLALRDALTEKLDILIHETPSRPGTATLEPGHTRHSMMSRLRRPRPARAVPTGG